MGKVYAYLLTGKGGNEVFEMADRLDTFCKLHFWDEEKVMEEINFSDILIHKAQHALFVTHLENFIGRYEEQNSVKNIDDLLLLRKWFLEHIEAFDKKYAEFKKQTN
jgi:hemerythrin